MKGLSPLMATVMLIAFTLAVAALIGSWVTSMVKTETNIVESGATEQINCSAGILDIVSVICASGAPGNVTIAIQNLGMIDLYDFSAVFKINSTLHTNGTYSNSSVAPNSTDPLGPGEQFILSYSYTTTNATISSIRIAPRNCPQAYAEDTITTYSCS